MSSNRHALTASFLVTLAVETAVVFRTTWAARLDTSIYAHGARLSLEERPRRVARDLVQLGAPATVVVAGVAVTALAFKLRGAGDAGRCASVLLGANATTQLMQALLDGPRELSGYGVIDSRFPSGHVTGVAAVSACAAVVARERARPAAIVAGIGATGLIAAAMLVSGAHLLSDVLAALLVVGAWSAAVGPRPAP